MDEKYNKQIADSIKFFWDTKKKQGNVLAGKQLDAFLALLTQVAVDAGNYYPQHNIYYITGNEMRQLRILAAILMSEFVRNQLDNLTNHMNGGYARWQSQYLRKLHVPNVEHIPSELADSLLKCYEDNNVSGINYYVVRIISNEKENPATKAVIRPKPKQLTLSFE